MPFEKGVSGNPAGRQPGSGNKAKTAFRDLVNGAVKIEDILKDLEECKPRDRVQFKIKLLEFGQPRLRSIEVTDNTQLETWMAMTPAERKIELLRLMQERHGSVDE